MELSAYVFEKERGEGFEGEGFIVSRYKDGERVGILCGAEG